MEIFINYETLKTFYKNKKEYILNEKLNGEIKSLTINDNLSINNFIIKDDGIYLLLDDEFIKNLLDNYSLTDININNHNNKKYIRKITCKLLKILQVKSNKTKKIIKYEEGLENSDFSNLSLLINNSWLSTNKATNVVLSKDLPMIKSIIKNKDNYKLNKNIPLDENKINTYIKTKSKKLINDIK